MSEENKVLEAFEVIKQAMIDDNPEQLGSYAHVWHCNIAMAVEEAQKEVYRNVPDAMLEEIRAVANDAASRVMKSFFDVKTKG